MTTPAKRAVSCAGKQAKRELHVWIFVLPIILVLILVQFESRSSHHQKSEQTHENHSE